MKLERFMYMEFSEVINARKSIRKFKPDPVPQAYIAEIVNTARLAPSASNIQSTRLVVLKSPEVITSLKGYTTPFVSKAPVVIVCCAYRKAWERYDEKFAELVKGGALKDNEEDGVFLENSRKNGTAGRSFNGAIAQNYLWQHAAIAMDHMTLKAVELGLGSCWVGFVDRQGVKQLLGLDDEYEVVALLPIGYPDQFPPQRPRITVDEFLLKEI
jgi:nitroreductase